MFDVFDQFGVPSTCTMNAKMGIERRAVIDAALNRGWEIVAHNYVQTELLADYSSDENKEREVIRETLRVYKEVCGKPARAACTDHDNAFERTARATGRRLRPLKPL